MGPNDSRIPHIIDSYSGQPITGANYFNLRLSNALNGKNYTEYVRMSEALASNRDWFSTLPRETRPMATVYREERASQNTGYSFMMPMEELNQSMYRDKRNVESRAAHERHYVPFQSSNASMGNFNDFVHEQFSNAINASLSNCPFRNNIRPHEMEQFKTQLINEISRNPAFMTNAVNKARDEALEYHYPPFDRNNFIQKARDETSPEFLQLNSAINAHVHDMHHNRKQSFNPEFNELSRPLMVKVNNLYMGNPNPQPTVDGEISDFVKKMIRQDRTAGILADTFSGTIVEKALRLVRTGKRIVAGVQLAGVILNNPQAFDQTIAQINDGHHYHKTQSRGHSMRR